MSVRRLDPPLNSGERSKPQPKQIGGTGLRSWVLSDASPQAPRCSELPRGLNQDLDLDHLRIWGTCKLKRCLGPPTVLSSRTPPAQAERSRCEAR